MYIHLLIAGVIGAGAIEPPVEPPAPSPPAVAVVGGGGGSMRGVDPYAVHDDPTLPHDFIAPNKIRSQNDAIIRLVIAAITKGPLA